MRTGLLAVVAATLLAACAASNGTRPGAPEDEAQPAFLAGPDITAYVAVGGVT